MRAATAGQARESTSYDGAVALPSKPALDTQATACDQSFVSTDSGDGLSRSDATAGSGQLRRSHRCTTTRYSPVTSGAWARQAAGLSQGELAKRMGVTRQQVSLLESSGSNMTIGTIEKVAKALGLPWVLEIGEPSSRKASA